MRYLISFVFVLALVASPLGVCAQDADKGWVEEFYPELAPREPLEPPPPEPAPTETAPEPTPEEPTLQLKLDDDGVQVEPGYPTRRDELELRVKRARIGVLASAGVVGVSTVFIIVGAATNPCFLPSPEEEASCRSGSGVLVFTGAGLVFGGIVGLMISGSIMSHRKRKLRRLEYEYYRTQRPARWDAARSRLVF